MWEYNYSNPDVLCHYGVKGMKWGHRRAQRYTNQAQMYRSSAKELDVKAQKAFTKRGATKYTARANELRDAAKIYDKKAQGTYSKRAENLKSKASIDRESAKEWSTMAKTAKSKGKFAKATKYEQYAKSDMDRAKRREQKAKRIVDNKINRRKTIGEIDVKSRELGRNEIEKIKKKLQS